MSNKKKPITFYAEDDVKDWYESLGYGEGTRQINDIIRAHITGSAAKKKHKNAKQPFALSLSFSQMKRLLETLDEVSDKLDHIEENAVDMDDPDVQKAIVERDDLNRLIAYIKGEL